MANSVLPRGFKAKAERLSLEYREKLAQHVCAPLDAFKLAEYMCIPIFTPNDFFSSKEDVNKLCGTPSQDTGWSALTMTTSTGDTIIIHNHLHSPARQQSNLMHELAHIICEHKIPEEYKKISLPIGMRFCNEVQEEEAKFLGAALQIAKPGLHWAFKRNMDYQTIAKHFNASEEMVKFRVNSTGILKQRAYILSKGK
jgi:Zn-dependent peptidase ImmA (M78 family)